MAPKERLLNILFVTEGKVSIFGAYKIPLHMPSEN